MRSQGCRRGGVIPVAHFNEGHRRSWRFGDCHQSVQEAVAALSNEKGFRSGIAAVLPQCLCLHLHFSLATRCLLGSVALPVWFLVTDPSSQEVTFTARRKVILQDGGGGNVVAKPHSPGSSSALPPGNWVALLGHLPQHLWNWDTDSFRLLQLREGSVGYWTFRGQHLCQVRGADSVTWVLLRVQGLLK